MTMWRGKGPLMRPLVVGWHVLVVTMCLTGCPAVAGVGGGGGLHSLISVPCPSQLGGKRSPRIVTVSETLQGGQDDGMKMILGFEARSNRLTSADVASLDRLAATLGAGAQPNDHLIVLAPVPRDLATRHFVASRLSVVEQELLKRGIAGETVKIPSPESNDVAIVLWVAPRTLPNTPLEMLPTAAETPQSVVEPREQTGNVPPSSPTSLLPGEDGGKGTPSTVSVEVVSEALTQDDKTAKGVSSNKEGEPAPATVIPPVDAEEVWIAAVGQSLRSVLREWGDRAGWTVVWQSDREYPIDAAATFSGDFITAASQLFDGFATATPAPSAHFYKGNHVLLVESGEGR